MDFEIEAGNVEYSRSDARIPIQDLIDALTDAQENGAEYVVGLSGNYRGAKYMHLSWDE